MKIFKYWLFDIGYFNLYAILAATDFGDGYRSGDEIFHQIQQGKTEF